MLQAKVQELKQSVKAKQADVEAAQKLLSDAHAARTASEEAHTASLTELRGQVNHPLLAVRATCKTG